VVVVQVCSVCRIGAVDSGRIISVSMSTVDAALYKWILAANDRRMGLAFPPGLLEGSLALLLILLGQNYLEHLLRVCEEG